MALLNEILVGRFSRMLQRFTAIKNSQAAVPQLAPEIQPGIDVSNMPPELRWLGNDKLCEYGNTATAGAATLSYAQVGAPTVAGSPGILVVIERIIISNLAGAATEFEIGLSSLSTRAAQAAQVRDIRANPNLGAFGVTARCTSGSDATGDGVAMLAQPIRFNVPAAPSSPVILDVDFVVVQSPTPGAGGRAVTIRCIQANQAFDFGFLFRERVLEESEWL